MGWPGDLAALIESIEVLDRILQRPPRLDHLGLAARPGRDLAVPGPLREVPITRLVVERAGRAVHTHLAMHRKPAEQQRYLRVGGHVPPLVTRSVGEEPEVTCFVDLAQQHVAGTRSSGRVSGGEHHGVEVRTHLPAGICQPLPEGLDRFLRKVPGGQSAPLVVEPHAEVRGRVVHTPQSSTPHPRRPHEPCATVRALPIGSGPP